MPNKYCQKCNKATTYSDSIPIYCSSCGKPFAGATIASIANEYELEEEQPVKPIKKQLSRRKPAPVEFEEELEDEIYDDEEEESRPKPNRRNRPSINPEDLFEIKLPRKESETLGNLILDQTERQTISRPVRDQTKEEFLKEWQSELVKKPSQEIGGK